MIRPTNNNNNNKIIIITDSSFFPTRNNDLGNSIASDHHKYEQELKKRLNLEIELIQIREQMSQLKIENDAIKSKNNELEKVLNSRNEKIRTLISKLSVGDFPIMNLQKLIQSFRYRTMIKPYLNVFLD